MKLWIDLHKVKSIRFIDDTFTLHKKRVIELCQAIISNQIRVPWACLSRVDNLDEELLGWMKKAGCMRIYFGMESGSQRMLDIYKKNAKVGDALETLRVCQKTGIETAVFFMSGHPEETEKDFRETIDFAKTAPINYASFNPLRPYPGTQMFNEVRSLIDFSIYPYKNEWKDNTVLRDYDRRKLIFYKEFYLSLNYFRNNVLTLFRNSRQIASMGFKLLRYLWWDKQFIIGGKRTTPEKKSTFKAPAAELV
jgi:radical SAM superfamily enzyme YgiQ (UPF0313 family)